MKIVGLGLLVVFLGYLIMIVLPMEREENHPRPVKSNSYEPKFVKEGELYFLENESMDTIRKLDIELAETREEISYGMMYRKQMDPETGMLFLMGQEKMQSFYMKNTYVSLDIIFINKDMEIVSIQRNAIPLNEQSLPSEGPASFVLETIGGYCEKHGIDKGTRIAYTRVNS